MSMKRSKRAGGSSRASGAEAPISLDPLPAAKTWEDAVGNQPDEAFKPYALAKTFAKHDLLSHPKFGKGLVTLVEGTRVEVLFQEGSKKLAHAGG